MIKKLITVNVNRTCSDLDGGGEIIILNKREQQEFSDFYNFNCNILIYLFETLVTCCFMFASRN